MEIRMPVMMVGAAAGRMTLKGRAQSPDFKGSCDVQPLAIAPSRDTERGIDQHRPYGTDKDHKD